MSRPQVLVVDDDADLRRLLELQLRQHGMEVVTADSGASGLQAAATSAADVVLLDLGLPDMNGLDVLRALRVQGHPSAVVVMTGRPTYEAAVAALKEGADNFITKPLDPDLLVQLVRKAAESTQLRRRLAAANRPSTAVDSLRACPSSAMMRFVDAMVAVAASHGNVLLTGETGTGKSLAARALHELSPRATGAFVELNCASLSAELLESELFGHAAGAFTGALRAKPGLFEVADQGTLFLDEIADMAIGVQPKLLKAIEDGRIRRLGSVESHEVDARVVAASHFELKRLADEGRFRADLYFRLDVLRLRVPPLRERAADIPVLAASFLRRTRRDAGPTLALADEAVEWLCAQPWPGNVRELQNVIERAAVHARGSVVRVADLMTLGLPSVRPAAPEPRSLPAAERTLDAAMRLHVQRVLSECAGNRSETARVLGVTRQTLLRRLRGWGLDDDAHGS